MTSAPAPYPVPLYQGEDWSQQLSFFADDAQTQPLVFTSPVMDIRGPRTRYATFDTSGSQEGVATVSAPGVLTLTLPRAQTVLIPPGEYDLDIFADVDGSRRAITKRGSLQLVVTGRITRDDP